MLAARKNYDGSQMAFCKTLGVHPAAYTQLKKAYENGQFLDKLIKDSTFVSIGRMLNVHFKNEPIWNIIHTEAFDYITTALQYCQEKSIGRILCDIADLGKSTAAKHYMLNNSNVFYVDCGQCKEKGEFIRALGKVVGVNINGSIKDIYRDTIFMIQAMDKPIIILDEWGDLGYTAFLQTKAYWNALEGACGWYMMGADGLRKKIESGLTRKIVGFAEMYRRLGGEFMSYTGHMNPAQLADFKRRQVISVAEHNLPTGADLKDGIKNTLSLTRVKENIKKIDTGGNELFDNQNEAA